MKLPELSTISQSTITTSVFYGLNRLVSPAAGETTDETNMTAEGYPVMMPRRRRSVYATGTATVYGLTAKDSPIWIAGTKLYMNGNEVQGITLSRASGMLPKQLVSMGAYLVIFPDKIWLNTKDTTEYGYLEQTNTTSGSVTFQPCAGDGTVYDLSDATVSETAPDDPEDGDWWINTSTDPHGLYRYSSATAEWSGYSSVYIKITYAGIGSGLQVYDGVTISGITGPSSEPTVQAQLQSLNGTGHPVYGCGTDYVVVAGMLDKSVSNSETMTIKREVPDMQYVCELDNRLWGCKYGMVNGETVNEIYASALGDPKVWNRFLGGSTDSYTVSVGSDGTFTGITSHGGYVLAWKEDCVHRIYGTMPSSYQLTTVVCEGVQNGSWQSLVNVNGVLYYKGRSHVLAYDGSLPTIVSEKLGTDIKYSDARAGCYGKLYYINMKKADDTRETLTYDTGTGLWHREDTGTAGYFTRTGESLLFVNQDSKIMDARGESGTKESYPAFEAVLARTGYDYANRKYLSRYQVRLRMAADAQVTIWLQYDSNGKWVRQQTVKGKSIDNVIMIPVKPKRCDHMEMKITGSGDVKVYSIARILEVGGDGA